MNKVQASSTFNLRTIQRDYINKCLSEQTGHKYLVLDSYTMDCIAVSYFRSELFDFNVFDTVNIKAIENLTTQGSTEGVFILKPTDDNIALLTGLLPNCPFDHVYLCILTITSRLY